MNKLDRKRLTKLGERCGTIQDMINEIKDEIEQMQDIEQEKFDKMPEHIQDGEKGESVQSAIDSMVDIINALEEASTAASTAMDEINSLSES
jgi:methyl-accepting chemotaxis protein